MIIIWKGSGRRSKYLIRGFSYTETFSVSVVVYPPAPAVLNVRALNSMDRNIQPIGADKNVVLLSTEIVDTYVITSPALWGAPRWGSAAMGAGTSRSYTIQQRNVRNV